MTNSEVSPKLSREGLNLLWLSLIAIIESLQVLMIAGWISSMFPLKVDMGSMFAIYRQYVYPERDTSLYRIFVLSAVAIQAGAFGLFRRRLADPAFGAKLRRFLVCESCLMVFLCFAVFKIFVYDAPVAAVYLFKGLLAAGIILKICWRWIDPLWMRLGQRLDHFHGSPAWRRAIDITVCVFIAVALFVPDAGGVIARIYNGDGFLHFDTFVMAPGWAALKGGAPYVDHYSQYGAGLPVMMAALARFIPGGFSYENILRLFVLMTIAYFILIYVFLRFWLKDVVLAAAGVLWAIKCQMFSYGDFFILQFPMNMVVRHFFDAVFFMLLLGHLRTQRRIFVILAGMMSGVAMFYINDTGMFLLAAFYAYGVLLLLLPHARDLVCRSRNDILFVLLCAVVPVAVDIALLFAVSGKAVATPVFWRHATEMIQFVTRGLHAVPVMDNLKNKNFINFFMACGVALTYLFTLVFVVGLNALKKINRESLVAAVLSVYGLSLFHYYVLRSTPSAFYTVSVPFALIVVFWIHRGLCCLNAPGQKRARVILLGVSVFALVTTHSFLQYPNILNLGGMSFEKDEQMMDETFISQTDVDLIRRLTRVDEKVALISSFEVATLMAADRKPFFYTFNLVASRSMNMTQFGGWKLLTPEQFERMMTLLTDKAPSYVFVERHLISGALPEVYYRYYGTLKEFADYLKSHYRPVEIGKYLIALKRL